MASQRREGRGDGARSDPPASGEYSAERTGRLGGRITARDLTEALDHRKCLSPPARPAHERRGR